jgi:hypothetical protein
VLTAESLIVCSWRIRHSLGWAEASAAGVVRASNQHGVRKSQLSDFRTQLFGAERAEVDPAKKSAGVDRLQSGISKRACNIWTMNTAIATARHQVQNK